MSTIRRTITLKKKNVESGRKATLLMTISIFLNFYFSKCVHRLNDFFNMVIKVSILTGVVQTKEN